MTETAHDRLRTIASNTDLGSGMAVAMKDLEIRGAGNLLGGEQSGHIQGVGFDLYVRLIGEAVADFRGETSDVPAEIKIELPVNAHLPHDYVPGERLRLEAYKKLASVESDAGVDEIEAELRDRYGAPPEPVRNLLEVARLRVVARQAHIGDIGLQGKVVRFGPVKDLRESQQLRLHAPLPRHARQGGARHDPRAGPDDGPGRRQAAARRRGARLGAPAHHRRAARRHRGRPCRGERRRPGHRRMTDASARGGNQ